MRIVVGLFDNANEAQRTIDELVQLGFDQENISVVTNTAFQPSMETPTGRFDTMTLNDVGRVAARGPLCAALTDKSLGMPGLRGALQRFGLTSDLAEHYVSGVQHGETLESIVVDDDAADRVVGVMKRHSAPRQDLMGGKAEGLEEEKGGGLGGAELGAGAAGLGGGIAAKAGGFKERISEKIDAMKEKREEKKEKAEMAAGLSGAPATEVGERADLKAAEAEGLCRDEELTVPIVREEIRVGKRTVERGGVRLSVHTVERPISEDIHLRESHVDIERRPMDRTLRADEIPFKDATVEMSEQAEEPVVSKQARLVEEIVIHKHVSDRVEKVADTVRMTEVDIGKRRPFDSAEYRAYFDSQGMSGANFDEYAPAYKFGHELYGGDLKGERWEDIETGARDRWESTRPGTWDRFKDSIRDSWNRARGKVSK